MTAVVGGFKQTTSRLSVQAECSTPRGRAGSFASDELSVSARPLASPRSFHPQIVHNDVADLNSPTAAEVHGDSESFRKSMKRRMSYLDPRYNVMRTGDHITISQACHHTNPTQHAGPLPCAIGRHTLRRHPSTLTTINQLNARSKWYWKLLVDPRTSKCVLRPPCFASNLFNLLF